MMVIFIKRVISYFERKNLNKILVQKNIKLAENVIFKKCPIIQIHKDSQLIIEGGVTINSDNYGYHVNMFSKCKIMADKPNAIIKIGSNTRFHGSCVHAYTKIEIGKNCLIAANCQIIDANGHDPSFPNVADRINTIGESKAISIKDNVWLGTGVIVLPGVIIGEGSIISANSVVNKNIPSYALAGGNPVQIFKQFKNNSTDMILE
jgi:acetyltransferase-like isoleucine patch superfamily enzyme